MSINNVSKKLKIVLILFLISAIVVLIEIIGVSESTFDSNFGTSAIIIMGSLVIIIQNMVKKNDKEVKSKQSNLNLIQLILFGILIILGIRFSLYGLPILKKIVNEPFLFNNSVINNILTLIILIFALFIYVEVKKVKNEIDNSKI